MRLSGAFFLGCACAAVYLLPTGCGGSIEVVDGGAGGGGGGGGTGGGAGGSSGSGPGIVSSSSGSPGSGSGSSTGGIIASSSSTSGGAPAPSPNCAGQPLPAIAKLCPDGVTASTPYYTWDGTQCVLAFTQCPTGVNPGGPIMSSSSSSSGSGIATTCMSALDCPAREVCCATLAGTTPGTACGPAPCSVLPIIGMSVQLCASSTECLAGEICEKPTNGILASVGITLCVSPQLDASAD